MTDHEHSEKEPRPEHEIALDIIGFIRDRLVAEEPNDFESLTEALDKSIPEWSDCSYSALRDALHLAFSERDHMFDTSPSEIEYEQTLELIGAISRLYSGKRAPALLEQA